MEYVLIFIALVVFGLLVRAALRSAREQREAEARARLDEELEQAASARVTTPARPSGKRRVTAIRSGSRPGLYDNGVYIDSLDLIDLYFVQELMFADDCDHYGADFFEGDTAALDAATNAALTEAVNERLSEIQAGGGEFGGAGASGTWEPEPAPATREVPSYDYGSESGTDISPTKSDSGWGSSSSSDYGSSSDSGGSSSCGSSSCGSSSCGGGGD